MEEVIDESAGSTRFDSIALERDASESFKNSNSVSLIISIESFHIIEERVQKHVIYKITGEENSEKFEISRRYKEFRILHRVLSQIWPGCLIPKLPKKKAIVSII